jgi:glycolate oxidase iron-sulfur subunit
MTSAIESCVHCGLCLPACPTYVTLGEEMDSPRGRIILIKETLEGTLDLEQALPSIDNCLGCEACVTACPSGVGYGDLLTAFRAFAEPRRSRSRLDSLRGALVRQVVPYPRRFRTATRVGTLARRLAKPLPAALEPLWQLLPARLPRSRPLPPVQPALGRRRGRVALLAGCAQQVLEPGINWATLRVLARNGIETTVPSGQACCGALALHTGAEGQAMSLARRILTAFPKDVDAVVVNAAGCGSGMRGYELLFAGQPELAAAKQLAERVVDVSVFLDQIGLEPPPATEPVAVAYQDACHLAHAQGVRDEPRRLLAAIPGVTLVEPAEQELCCGSAGTYNIERPAIAAELGARKVAAVLASHPDVICTGNIGCMTQLRAHLRAAEDATPVLHTMELLDRAYARQPLADKPV